MLESAVKLLSFFFFFGPSPCIWYTEETPYFKALSTKLDQFHKIMTVFHSLSWCDCRVALTA